ncbi:MAG: hypothetical protein AB2689_11135 [Candidatus Thiodiazotropha taylori]|nr:hypothetical protein [Candidatus Thiodiazotropha taylori]MCW4316761.1 hypothetical protein [Candidatus Thiodiazotropha taylori]
MKKMFVMVVLVTSLFASFTASADLFGELRKLKEQLIDKPIHQLTRFDVKVHNKTNSAVVVVLGGDRVTIAPHGNHAFRNKGAGDRVTVHFYDTNTGNAIRSIDKGILHGNISVEYTG